MMGLNKVQLIGHLGRDPESRTLQSGGTVVTLSVATSEPWIDRDSGDRRDKTEWHRVAIFSDGLGEITTRYLRKGSKVYVEGRLQTRKWQDQSGADRYTTEVVLQRLFDRRERSMLGARQHTEQRVAQRARPTLDPCRVAPEPPQRGDPPIAVDQHQPLAALPRRHRSLCHCNAGDDLAADLD